MAWTTPKTNWVSTDYFNYSDYNRIIGNLKYLLDLANEIYASFSYESMAAVGSYTFYWMPSQFNRIESNLKILYDNITHDSISFGSTKSFTYNGKFIDYGELNRIERLCLIIHTQLETQKKGRLQLAFNLRGGMKLGGSEF